MGVQELINRYIRTRTNTMFVYSQECHMTFHLLWHEAYATTDFVVKLVRYYDLPKYLPGSLFPINALGRSTINRKITRRECGRRWVRINIPDGASGAVVVTECRFLIA